MPTTQAPLPPNPSLLALYLVIRTRSGPRFVFHYPASPSTTPPKSSWQHTHKNDDSSSNSSDNDSTSTVSEDEESADKASSTELSIASGRKTDASRGTSNSGATRRTTRTLREDVPDDEEDDEVPELNLGPSLNAGRERSESGGVVQNANKDGTEKLPEWENVLGFSTNGLEKLLSPSRDLRKKRFELMLDDLVFLGYPVFVREDGAWRKKKGSGRSKDSQEKRKAAQKDLLHEKDRMFDSPAGSPKDGGIAIKGSRGDQKAGDNLAGSGAGTNNLSTSYKSQSAMSEAQSEARSTSTSSGNSSNEMTMFHVVFVMNPPPLEHHVRVGDMYDNVVKKFAKALKYEQSSKDYVWQEAKKILELRASGKQNGTPINLLWTSIMQVSPLAKLMGHIYDSICASRIAHAPISKTVETSFQIPQSISTSYAPTPSEPQLPGLWLTTASMADDDDDTGTTLSPYAALLLLEEKETLLKQIEKDNHELATALAFFIRELTPTKSLQKMAVRMSLRLPDLQFLARHLIYWRRARAIPPLHIRDTYIVSPNADMKQLSDATLEYERKFTGLPSLPRMLQSLSARPIQFGYLIPSHDHKQPYVEMLSWLLKNGWVTELRTFAWVRISPDIKAKVAQHMRNEDLKSSKSSAFKRVSITSGASSSDIAHQSASEDEGSNAKLSQSASMADLLSPMQKSLAELRMSDTASISSHRTAMQMGHSPRPSPLSIHDIRDPLTPLSVEPSTASATERSSSGLPHVDPVAFEQSLVLDPLRATAEESKWLAAVGEGFEDLDMRDAWPALTRYLDGRSAMEDVAAREGWKRSKVSSLVARLDKAGVLCIVRHW